jgi:hypothetical protein
VDVDLPCRDVNFHIADNDAYYGDGATQAAHAMVGDVIIFEEINLKDIFFKNYTGGSNCTITVVASVPTKYIDQELKK